MQALVVSSRPNNGDGRIINLLVLLIIVYPVDFVDEGLSPIEGKLFEILNLCLIYLRVKISYCSEKADYAPEDNWIFQDSTN